MKWRKKLKHWYTWQVWLNEKSMRDDTNCVNKKVLMSNIDYEFRTVKLRSHINCFCFVSCVDIYLHVLITVVKSERLTKSRLNLPWFILHRIGHKPDPCIIKGQPIQTALFLLGIWLQKVRNADWVGWVLTTVAYSSRSAGGWVLIFWFFTSPDLNNYEETLPKALRTQALTALTSNFGRFGRIVLVW